MAGEVAGQDKLFVGCDFSTQQIKALVVTSSLEVVYDIHVRFDTDLSEYKTHGGVHMGSDHKTASAPPRMWVQAFDLLLDRMKAAGVPFDKICALSGCSQQCGSVYWKKGSRSALNNLQPDKSAFEQLKDCFSLAETPIWMDATTTEQCRQLEEKVGGAMELAKITGSGAHEHFTGPHIMKIFQTKREAYDNTERISLISSFAASLFIGDYAPIDQSDASYTNLMDLWKREWSPKCLEACGTDLGSKLGPLVHSTEEIGRISSYLVERYGFNPDCIVSAFVGDNPASLAGLAPEKGEVVISMGTSDSMMVWLSEPKISLAGHINVNPIHKTDFMSLCCFKNGSLTRERIRDEKAGGSWDTFNEMLQKTPLGNKGNLGIYFDVVEFEPFAEGVFRFGADGNPVDSFPPEVEVRAVLEGHFVAGRVHAENAGFPLGPNNKVIATGGGSKNEAILQVLSDVFNTPVFVKDVPDSAGLGCTMRAKHTFLGLSVPFSEIAKGAHPCVQVATPRESNEVYTQLV